MPAGTARREWGWIWTSSFWLQSAGVKPLLEGWGATALKAWRNLKPLAGDPVVGGAVEEGGEDF